MPNERAIIGPDEVKRARRAAEARSYSDQDPLVIADERSEGLSIKVRGKAASWILKYKGKSRKLGP